MHDGSSFSQIALMVEQQKSGNLFYGGFRSKLIMIDFFFSDCLQKKVSECRGYVYVHTICLCNNNDNGLQTLFVR
jgi:hypothetical protein